MEALLDKLVQLISDNGGKLEWNAMLAALTYDERKILIRAVDTGRANGRFRRVLRFNPETHANELTLEPPVTGGE
jgi:hypothetical protein